MTFLNPYVLFALVAASFPVLFHLFAQRRARRVEFSSIRFLKQLEKSSMRKVKLRQILLLILRTLLIVFLVLAFARPALRGFLGGFFGSSHANTTAIVLFDNSASMARRDANGTFFKQAQDAAMRIADALESGDELMLVPIATIEGGRAYTRLHDPQEIRKAISELSLSDAPAKLGDGLRVAAKELARSANVNREVYLVSDGQTRNLKELAPTDSSLKLFDARTSLFVTTVGTSSTARNLAIDSLVPVTTVFEQGRAIEFDAYVRNTGEGAVENAVVSLFYNDERVAQRSVTALASGKTEKCSIGALPKGTGMLNVRAELEDDALPFDNKRYLSLELPATSHVAIFTNAPEDAEFLRLALEQTLSETAAPPYAIEVHRLEELRMLPSLQSRLDAVIVELGAGAYDAVDMKALHEYIASGRGVALLPLPQLTSQDFNTAVAPMLGLPTMRSLEGSLAPGSKYASLAQFDLAHPFFAGMFDQNSNPNSRGIESPKFYQYFTFANGGVPLVKLSTGSALISDVGVGKGHVIVFSVPPTFAFSDLPRKPIFLPLVRRTAAYLASLKGKERNVVEMFTAGDPIDFPLPSGLNIQPNERLLVRGPNGLAERVEIKGTASGAMHIQIEQSPFAGIYSIFKDANATTAIAAFAVNPVSDESAVATSSSAELRTALERYTSAQSAVNILPALQKDLAEAIRKSRFGVELWQLFLAIAVCCAVAEMLIAREGKSMQS